MDDVRGIDSLAAKLKRPARLWPTLGQLPAERLRFLDAAVDEACRRRDAETEAALYHALPRPFGGLLVKLLRRGGAR